MRCIESARAVSTAMQAVVGRILNRAMSSRLIHPAVVVGCLLVACIAKENPFTDQEQSLPPPTITRVAPSAGGQSGSPCEDAGAADGDAAGCSAGGANDE